jgi:hypothetical protein
MKIDWVAVYYGLLLFVLAGGLALISTVQP